MRLIDADNFMEFMNALEEHGAEWISFDDLKKFIKEQPTASHNQRTITSNDLISRSAAIEEFYKRVGGDFMVDDVEKIEEVIMEVPTAYDKDKVVASLGLLSENAENADLNTYEEKAAYCTAYSKAIEMVKAGGTDE